MKSFGITLFIICLLIMPANAQTYHSSGSIHGSDSYGPINYHWNYFVTWNGSYSSGNGYSSLPLSPEDVEEDILYCFEDLDNIMYNISTSSPEEYFNPDMSRPNHETITDPVTGNQYTERAYAQLRQHTGIPYLLNSAKASSRFCLSETARAILEPTYNVVDMSIQIANFYNSGLEIVEEQMNNLTYTELELSEEFVQSWIDINTVGIIIRQSPDLDSAIICSIDTPCTITIHQRWIKLPGNNIYGTPPDCSENRRSPDYRDLDLVEVILEDGTVGYIYNIQLPIDEFMDISQSFERTSDLIAEIDDLDPIDLADCHIRDY